MPFAGDDEKLISYMHVLLENVPSKLLQVRSPDSPKGLQPYVVPVLSNFVMRLPREAGCESDNT